MRELREARCKDSSCASHLPESPLNRAISGVFAAARSAPPPGMPVRGSLRQHATQFEAWSNRSDLGECGDVGVHRDYPLRVRFPARPRDATGRRQPPRAGAYTDYDFDAGDSYIGLRGAHNLARGSLRRTSSDSIRALQARTRELHALALQLLSAAPESYRIFRGCQHPRPRHYEMPSSAALLTALITYQGTTTTKKTTPYDS